MRALWGLFVRLVTGVAVIVAMVVAGRWLSRVFQPKNNQAEFGMIEPAANGFLGEREGSIDVLFVGDSEVYTSLSPMQMWGEHGFTSYDAATAGQTLAYGNTLLKRALSRHHPRVVVFETNFLYKEYSISDGLFRLAADALPVLEYHDRWKSLTPADLTFAPVTTWSDEHKGFRVNTNVSGADADGSVVVSDGVFAVPLKNRLRFHAMVERCRRHGAVPVLLSTPSLINWSMEKHNGIELLAKELDIRYLDLNLLKGTMGIDWRTETYDGGDHLNYGGAKKVSRYVGSYLAREFSLADNRQNPTYESWNDTYARYLEHVRT